MPRGCGVWGLVRGLGFRVSGLGLGVQVSGFGGLGSGELSYLRTCAKSSAPILQVRTTGSNSAPHPGNVDFRV